MESEVTPVVFTPDNEPYLGRQLLFHFDQLICSAMEQNAVTAPATHGWTLTDHQRMACQVIAQALSVTLSRPDFGDVGAEHAGHVQRSLRAPRRGNQDAEERQPAVGVSGARGGVGDKGERF